MSSRHHASSSVIAAIAVALCVAAPVQSADAPADMTQTHGQATARSTLPPLADCLTRPYWRGTRKEWQAMLSMTSEAAGRDRFDVQARDELLSALARSVETSSRKAFTRVVIVESISGGISPRYTRHGAFVVNGADAADGDMLANAGFHRIDDKSWPAIAEPLAELLKLGGCNYGADIAYDGHDATVITYYDGRRWHTDTWFYLAQPLTVKLKEAFERKELRPVALQYLRLLEALSAQAPPDTVVGGPWARHLLEEFGDVGQDLILLLVRPYWKATEAEWRRLLVNASYDRADVREAYRDFDPGERDKWMTSIASAVAASPQRSSMRIVIVENVRGSQGTFARYNRHAVQATVKDAARPIPQFSDAAFRRLDADQWTAVEKPLADLMRIGGGNPGTDMIFDAYDATVISCFDGQNWRVETWFFLAWPRTADNEEAVEREQLRPATASYLRLLEAMAPHFPTSPAVGGALAGDLLKDLGNPPPSSQPAESPAPKPERP